MMTIMLIWIIVSLVLTLAGAMYYNKFIISLNKEIMDEMDKYEDED